MIWHLIQHWLAIHTGTLNEPGEYYGFWSGFGSDLGEGTIVVALAATLAHSVRKHNCHMPGCWRVGRHPIEGTGYVVCRKHHPEDHDAVKTRIENGK